MTDSTFGYEQPEDSPGLLLWQTTMLWQKRIRAELDKHKMTHSQFVVLAVSLWFTEHNHEATQVDIAAQSKLEKMTVSKALRELTQQGFVKRKEHEKDTRVKVVLITKKGLKKISALIPVIESIDERFFGTLSEQHRSYLISAFRSLVDAEESEGERKR
ncbi:MAG: MarR family winged helix-turn-helix transcriptional regulator [Oligoflexales bacterium]